MKEKKAYMQLLISLLFMSLLVLTVNQFVYSVFYRNLIISISASVYLLLYGESLLIHFFVLVTKLVYPIIKNFK